MESIQLLPPPGRCTIGMVSEVRSRDVSEALKHIAPNTIGFRFYDRDDLSEAESRKMLRPVKPEKNPSGRVYINGRVLTKEEVQREFPDRQKLVEDMERIGLERVVLTNVGVFQAFNEGDSVIDVPFKATART